MKLPLIEKELQALAVQQGLSLPVPAPRERARGKAAAKMPIALRQATQEALLSYRASADYRELLADMPSFDLAQLQSRCAAVLNGPYFASLKERLRDLDSLDIDLGDFIPKAISFGLLGQIVVGIGLSGSVGYVENLDSSNDEAAVFFGGAFDVGIDAGIQGDICIGFWTNDVSDLNGLYVGGEVDVDDGTGITVAMFLQDEEPALALVGVDMGVDDGIENEDFYFFHIDVGSNPIYQPGDAQYLIQLQKLTCDKSYGNYDHVTFSFQQDGNADTYHFPAWDGFQMAESQNDPSVNTWNVGAILKFNNYINLTLYVADPASVSDKIAVKTLTIWPTDFPGLYVSNSNPYVFDATVEVINKIKYSLVAQRIQ